MLAAGCWRLLMLIAVGSAAAVQTDLLKRTHLLMLPMAGVDSADRGRDFAAPEERGGGSSPT